MLNLFIFTSQKPIERRLQCLKLYSHRWVLFVVIFGDIISVGMYLAMVIIALFSLFQCCAVLRYLCTVQQPPEAPGPAFQRRRWSVSDGGKSSDKTLECNRFYIVSFQR